MTCIAQSNFICKSKQVQTYKYNAQPEWYEHQAYETTNVALPR